MANARNHTGPMKTIGYRLPIALIVVLFTAISVFWFTKGRETGAPDAETWSLVAGGEDGGVHGAAADSESVPTEEGVSPEVPGQRVDSSRVAAPAVDPDFFGLIPRRERAAYNDVVTSTWGYAVKRQIDQREAVLAHQLPGHTTRQRLVEISYERYPLMVVSEFIPDGNGPPRIAGARVADHVLVTPVVGLDSRDAAEALRGRGYSIRYEGDGTFLLVETDGAVDFESVDWMRERLELEADLVRFAEEDQYSMPMVIPLDPQFDLLWGLNNPATRPGFLADADIDAPEGWDILRDAGDIVVAITDSGIRYTHEDLRDNMWRNPGETRNGQDSDGNGWVDDIHGVDTVDGDADPMDPPQDGHGTHVAGTVGMVGNNGVGGTGVAWNVQLMAVRMIGPLSAGVEGLNYVRQMGADVVNASWGWTGTDNMAMRQAVAALIADGVPFIAAAGNFAWNHDNPPVPTFPSTYPGVIAVAATTSMDELAPFSDYGATTVHLAAPGDNIWSAVSATDRSYEFFPGTSMAAPHVSGAMALMKTAFPDETLDDLRERLFNAVDPLDSLEGRVVTGGRLNLFNCLGGGQIGPPENDNYQDATELEGPVNEWTASNMGATRQANEPMIDGQHSIWYSWTASEDGFMRFEASGTRFPRLTVFEGSQLKHARLVEKSQHLDPRQPVGVWFYARGGRNYRLALDSASPGTFNAVLYQRAPNDNPSLARFVGGDRFEVLESNVAATGDRLTGSDTNSVWYEWVPSQSGTAVMTTIGSGFDTVLRVYEGDRFDYPENFGNFQLVAENANAGPGLTYSSLSFQAVAGTSYFLVVYSQDGQTGLVRLNGMWSGDILIVNQPTDRFALEGIEVRFEVLAYSDLPLSYQWYFDDEIIPGAESAVYEIASVTEDDFGDYFVEITNGVNTVSSDVAALREPMVVPGVADISNHALIEHGQSLVLNARAAGPRTLGGGVRYQWYRDGLPLHGETRPDLDLSGATHRMSGTYSLRVTNDFGSSKSSPVNVNVRRTPELANAAYAEWRKRFGLNRHVPSISGPDADPDKDGVRNWMEYALGGDPQRAAEGGLEDFKEIEVVDGYLRMVYTRRRGMDHRYDVYGAASRDFVDWDSPEIRERVLSVENGIETIEALLPMNEAQGFLRLQVERD